MSRISVGARRTAAPPAHAVGNGNGNGNGHLNGQNGHAAAAIAPARPGSPAPGADVALPDWDVLLSAVTARLRQLALES